ncbi:MAG: hypothetical protein IPJ13_17670 [Saprospiraceae bacterium]|nr:hypothetical protein [Saprospiraceae bacterium]
MRKNRVLRQRTITAIFFAVGVVYSYSQQNRAIAFGCLLPDFRAMNT